MTETATILHHATAHSLVLMDEIGRGTSTYDGLSLAWACAEYLASKLKALTLFATHYFELTELPDLINGVANIHLDAMEHGDHLAFMHQVQPGAASKSYGLQVAQLAGVPKVVIQRARQKLQQLELSHPLQEPNKASEAPQQMPLLEEEHPVLQQLRSLDVDGLSARDALAILYRLQQGL